MSLYSLLTMNRDSKKLTFYYFADNYINFNSLVTDLFKIYKTRIWMSAINPASFVTPTASLAPTAFPGHLFGTGHQGRQSPANRRRHHNNNAPYGQSTHGAYEESYDANRAGPRTFQPPQHEQSYPPYSGYDNGGQQGYYPQAAIDPFTSYVPYQMLNANAPNFSPSSPGQEPRGRGHQKHQGGHGNWVGRFQGLSTGS